MYKCNSSLFDVNLNLKMQLVYEIFDPENRIKLYYRLIHLQCLETSLSRAISALALTTHQLCI